jgi:predicted dehydrogenase
VPGTVLTGKKLGPEDYDEVPIDTEDFGSVLLHLGDRARGAFTASQVSAGCKNRLQIEVYGTKASVIWNQERPDELWIGHRNTNNEIMLKSPILLEEKARTFADLPGGHSEGYDSAHKQNFRRFYATVRDRSVPAEYATFQDGYQMARVLEKVLESARTRSWVDVGA